MRKMFVALTLFLCAGSLFAADAADEARKTEIAFAKAFADRDAKVFFGFIDPDARFLSAKKTLSGKAAIQAAWAGLLADPQPSFSWAPERVVVNGAGNIALSTGPILDSLGKVDGYYSSIWQKESDGSWKIIFDGPGAPAPCDPAAH